MSTVVDDSTGEEVEVVPAHAVAAVASVNTLHNEFPPGAAKLIERAMVAAVQNAQSEGITNPVEIRALMERARRGAKASMGIRMNDLRSQEAAKEAARENTKEHGK